MKILIYREEKYNMKLGKLQLICEQVKGRVRFDLGHVQVLDAKTWIQNDIWGVNWDYKMTLKMVVSGASSCSLLSPFFFKKYSYCRKVANISQSFGPNVLNLASEVELQKWIWRIPRVGQKNQRCRLWSSFRTYKSDLDLGRVNIHIDAYQTYISPKCTCANNKGKKYCLWCELGL